MNRVFLAATDSGLVRADLPASGAAATVAGVAPGPQVTCLAADPLDGACLYAGTQGAGVLRSRDCGRTWQHAGLPGRVVTALAASPRQRRLVYAGVRPAGLFVSEDGGANWEALAGFQRIRGRRLWFSPAARPYRAYVQAIALSPTDPDRIVAGVEFGATVVSVDGGRHWSNHRRRSLRDCHSLCFHAADGNWVYEAGGTGGGAAFSTDGGRTWTQARQGLDRHYGWAVAADGADPATWYVAVAPGPRRAHGAGPAQARIFRRKGDAWQPLEGGLPQPLAAMPYALLTTPGEAGSLYAGLGSGEVWHSADCGANWQRLPVQLGRLRRALVLLSSC